MKTKYYIGLDVHKETTAYAVRDRLGRIVVEGQTPTIYEELFPKLKQYLNSAQIGLESTTYYYSLYQRFQDNGYAVKVANTVQIRQLINKNDKLDARHLAELLRLGNYPTSYVPDKKVQHLRNMVHLRHSLMEEKTRCNIRIQVLLDRNGIAMPPVKAFSKMWKHALNQHMGQGVLSLEFRYAYDHYMFLESKQKQIEQEIIGYVKAHWNTEYQLLQSIPGFATLLPCYIIAETCPINRFPNKRKLRRYAGVIPVFKESAGKKKAGHIPKTSSRKLLRWALVQAANTIAKTQTKLGKYYRKKKKQKKITAIAKIALASTLSDIIYEVMTKKKPYTTT